MSTRLWGEEVSVRRVTQRFNLSLLILTNSTSTTVHFQAAPRKRRVDVPCCNESLRALRRTDSVDPSSKDTDENVLQAGR